MTTKSTSLILCSFASTASSGLVFEVAAGKVAGRRTLFVCRHRKGKLREDRIAITDARDAKRLGLALLMAVRFFDDAPLNVPVPPAEAEAAHSTSMHSLLSDAVRETVH